MDWGKMMECIKESEPILDDPKFKRLHLFLTEKNIEKHMALLDKAKGKAFNDHRDSDSDS